MNASYTCSQCGERHNDLPMSYRMEFPSDRYPANSILFEKDGELCAAGDDRFITANIELPVIGSSNNIFVWTCWISLSHDSYTRLKLSWESPDRENEEPALGWLSSQLPTYEPNTFAIKTRIHVRPIGFRPWVELEPTEHSLYREQMEGISHERMFQIYHA